MEEIIVGVSSRRFIRIVTVLLDNVPTHRIITAFDEYDAYTGTLPLPQRYDEEGLAQAKREQDIANFDNIVRDLSPIPKESIYPVFTDDLTRFEPADDAADASNIYLKAPNISNYNRSTDDGVVAKLLHCEAKTHELLKRTPHPHLATYLGCVVDRRLVVRLAFKSYTSLRDRVRVRAGALPAAAAAAADSFPLRQREDCMSQIEAAVAHLHGLGLAHNDISPNNIMFDTDSGSDSGGDGAAAAVLIDLDCCSALGTPLVKGGLAEGWKGPPRAFEGRQFTESSAECDLLALQVIREWLVEDLGSTRPAGERQATSLPTDSV